MRRYLANKNHKVSTHSRPKAAARSLVKNWDEFRVSTHSRPKAAATQAGIFYFLLDVATHSRPKAAALSVFHWSHLSVGFNTQPPEGGCVG